MGKSGFFFLKKWVGAGRFLSKNGWEWIVFLEKWLGVGEIKWKWLGVAESTGELLGVKFGKA